MQLNLTDEFGFGFRLHKSNSSPFKFVIDVDHTRTNDDISYGEWGDVTTITQWNVSINYFGNGEKWWMLEEFRLTKPSVPFDTLFAYQSSNGVYEGPNSVHFQDYPEAFTFKVDTSDDDHINGNKFRDVVNSGAGHDVVNGKSGNDKLMGNAGNDYLDGNEGNDKLYGGPGRDTLRGEAGNDTLKGGKGDDELIVSAGQDKLIGGIGADTFVFRFSINSTRGPESRTTIKDFDLDEDMIDLGNLREIHYNEVTRGVVIKGEAWSMPIKALLLNIELSDLTIDHYVL